MNESKYADDEYRATMEGDIEALMRIHADDYAYEVWEFMHAIDTIEEAELIIGEEYDKIIEAKSEIVEYRYLEKEYETNPNQELLNKIHNLENMIINMSKNINAHIDTMPISEKKLITVKDFEKLYSVNEEAQRKLRKRFRDPLPFVQLVERGNVLYDRKEVEKWFENYKN